MISTHNRKRLYAQCRALVAAILLGLFLPPLNVFAQDDQQNQQRGQRTSVADEMFENLPGFQQKDQADEMVARPSRYANSQQSQSSLGLPGSAQLGQPDPNALDVEGIRHMKTVEVVGEGERYTLGPEDVVQIMVRNQPDFSGYFVVGPEGHIQYNWCGDVKAEGLTKEELKALLTERLAEYVRYPEVSVAIVEYNSKAVYVVGSVNKPGKYPMKGDHIELRDALVLAGLPTDTSALKRAKIVRETEDGPVDIEVNLKELLYKGQMDKNFELLPGDIVYVPMSRFVKTTDTMSQTLGPVFQAAAVYSIADNVMGDD